MGYLLGMDIGTQRVKGVFLNENLEIVAREYVEHDTTSTPRAGWREHDPEEVWWNGFRRTLNRLMDKVNFSPDEIIGVGCSSLGICMLPISGEGKPLRNALLYSDTRGGDQAREMVDVLGTESILRETKNSLSTEFAGPKMLWFRENEPQKYERTEKVLTSSNYIVHKLTGEFVLDHTQGAFFAPFYDYKNGKWNEEILEKFGFSPDLLPYLRSPTDVAGEVTKEAARSTGIPKGTPVIVSTLDGPAEFFSTGNLSEGLVTLTYGTASEIAMTVKGSYGPENFLTMPHPILPSGEFVAGATATSGALTKWFRNNFGQVEEEVQEKIGINAYQLLSQQATEVPPGSEGLVALPYFSGERTPINDEKARGLLIGLTTYHTRKHVYRALLEATAYAFKHHFELLRDHGAEVSRIIASGGGTKNDLWLQIVSDVTGNKQLVSSSENGSEIGVAYMVGLATGIISDLDELDEKLHKKTRSVTPDEGAHERYQDYYRIYRNLYQETADDMHALARMGQEDG